MADNWFQHTFDRTGQASRSQVTAMILLAVLIALIFGGVYLSQVASYATNNRAISELIAERDRLERENEALRANIAQLQTVPRLLERARQMGFRPATATDIQYLVIEGYNPDRQARNVPLVSDDEFQDAPQYDETFSGWLQQQWDGLRRQFESFGQ
jgi:cell division protein FtsB